MASIDQERKQSLKAANDITGEKYPIEKYGYYTQPKEKKPLVLRPEDEIEQSRRAASAIVDSAKKDKIDQEALKVRQRYSESAFNDKAVSPAGAKGAFQIMPKTAEEYAKKMGEEGDLFDPEYNGRMRDRIWNDLYNSYTATAGNPTDSVRVAKALAMYNRGRGAVGEWLAEQKKNGVDIYNSTAWVDSIPWPETKDYVKFNLFEEDIPNTSKTKAAFEKAKKDKGY